MSCGRARGKPQDKAENERISFPLISSSVMLQTSHGCQALSQVKTRNKTFAHKGRVVTKHAPSACPHIVMVQNQEEQIKLMHSFITALPGGVAKLQSVPSIVHPTPACFMFL